MIFPEVGELGVGADAERLGVGADGVEPAVRVELGAAHGLHVLQRGDGDEARPARPTAAAHAAVQLRVAHRRRRLLDGVVVSVGQVHRAVGRVVRQRRWWVFPVDLVVGQRAVDGDPAGGGRRVGPDDDGGGGRPGPHPHRGLPRHRHGRRAASAGPARAGSSGGGRGAGV